MTKVGLTRWVRLLLVAGLVVGGFRAGITQESAKGSVVALEPQVAAASNEPQQALAGVQLPDGWSARVFAAEPNVANIVAFSIDHQGRCWVCESYRQSSGVTDNRGHDETWLRADLAAKTVADRIAYHRKLLGEEGVRKYQEQDDRIRRLEDTDRDGVADQVTVFAKGFNALEEGTGAGVLQHAGAVYFTCIPKLWKFIDRDDDGVADERIVLQDGFGVRVAFRGHDMHGLIVGPDGRLYFSIGDRGYHLVTREGKELSDPASGAVFRCELDGSGLEVFATGLRNPQELAFDQYGNLFTGDNNSDSGDQARWVYVVEGGDSGWRMYYQYLPDRGPFNREKIWHPFHPEQPAYIVPPIANLSDGPSGLVYYPGTGLDASWDNTFFLADFRGTPSQSGVRAVRVGNAGASFKVERNEQAIWKVLATDVAFGPDGAFYISDWVDGWVGEGKGRIYRLTHDQAAKSAEVEEVRRLLAQDWSKATASECALGLRHADMRIRQAAQFALADRREAKPLIEVALDQQARPVARLHGIWGLEQIVRHAPRDSSTAELVRSLLPLLDDTEGEVRGAAVQFFGEHPDPQAQPRLIARLDVDSARVVYRALVAVSKAKITDAWSHVVQVLERNQNQDPVLRHGGIMAVAGLAKSDDEVASLAKHPSVHVRRAAAVALRRRASAQTAVYLEDTDPSVVAEAARAIHDLPIAGAMPALAAIMNRSSLDDETRFRAMNAGYRLGTDEHALQIAKVAGADGTERLRLEALKMLANWARPDERDLVLNDWRPLEPRDARPAVAALRNQLASILGGPKGVQTSVTKVAADYGITEIIPTLRTQFSTGTDPGLRGASLSALVSLDPNEARKLLKDAHRDSQWEVRLAAMEASVKLEPEQAASILIERTRSEEPREAQLAWRLLDSFAKQTAVRTTMDEGFDAYVRGELKPDVWLEVLMAAEKHGSAEFKDRLKMQEGRWMEENPLLAWRWALAGGDRGRGREVFFNKAEVSCVRCHKVGKQGGEVGPDLTAVAQKRDASYLLEAIVLPSAKIAEGFETVVLMDDSGTVHTGVLRKETEEFVEVMAADGSTKRIDKETIEARRKGQSAMPADLEKHLKRQELRDLVAYLASLRGDDADAKGHQ